jgi:hypothetical protein
MTRPDRPTEILALDRAYRAIEQDSIDLASALTEERAHWRPAPSAWSVVECLDHLTVTSRVYLAAMQPAADRASARGLRRRGEARPGLFGRWFIRTLEPPVKPRYKGTAPRQIQPGTSLTLSDTVGRFHASQDEVRAFLWRYADLDLAGVTFPNPFVRGIRFSLATGLHVIAAHERRHLWQAWQVRRAAEV